MGVGNRDFCNKIFVKGVKIDLSKWGNSYQKEANNTYFIYPSDEEYFKKAVFADSQNKGLVIRIFTNNNEFLLDRIVNSTQDSWSGNVTPQGFVNTFGKCR